MRRLGLVAGTLVAALAVSLGVAFGLGASARAGADGTFDVIFDNARGLVPGQLVKVAGANAGQIERVSVTDDFKARVRVSIDRRFLPLHADATCAIRPEGLIAENYIDCNVGSVGAGVLRGVDGRPATVSVARTTEPVSLLDLFNIFNLPTRQRFGVIADELGIATAAQGTNLNQIIRRANPALADARVTISELAAQHAHLATILHATDTIVAQAAAHSRDLQRFVDRAAALTTVTAAHHGALAAAVQRLPGLLAAAQPALASLHRVEVSGRPLVAALGAAAPALNTLSDRLGPFTAAARPALQRLGVTLRRAIPALRASAPLLGTVGAYLKRSLPSARELATVFASLQQRGFVESFLSLTYYLAALTARFDPTGHLGLAYLVNPSGGVCSIYATQRVAGCSANYR